MNISEVFHNRYALLQKVGSGGFSEVWKANDMRSGMEVAIKIFRKQDAEGISLCREEYLKTFEMSHPRIMTPFHFDVDQDRPYLVMKFLHGGTLNSKIGQMKTDEIRKLISQLSEALNYLHNHANAIVHGDIKPDNILIDDEGNFYLTDFGISTRLQEKFTETMMMPSDISLGKGVTPMAYRSPEHFKYKNWFQKPLTPRSDIWSAGVTLHHVIYDMLPFNGEGGLGQLIMMKSGNHDIEEIMDFPENDEYAEFQNLLIAAMELEPSERSAILNQVKNKKVLIRESEKTIDPKIINVSVPKKKNESRKLIYVLLMVFIITAVGIGYTFIDKDQVKLNDRLSSDVSQQIIEIDDDTLKHTGKKQEFIATNTTPSDNLKPEVERANNNLITNNKPGISTNSTSEKSTVISSQNNNPTITNAPEPIVLPNVENKIIPEEKTPEIKPIPEETKANKTATIKPNIPILLQLNEEINSTANYPAGSKIEFVVAADINSYGDVIIRKGTKVFAEVKKRNDKKLNIRFPNVYTSGGTKLKGLNLDNLEINVETDKKGKTYRPVTSSYQTNVLIN